MKNILSIICISSILSGCVINDPTKKAVSCTGIVHINTLDRDYAVKLTALREGKEGIAYYTNNSSFQSPWVNEKYFKRITCE